MLIVIAERNYQALDKNNDAQAITLDMKEFNKLKGHGVSGQIFYLILSFVSSCKMKVVLNGHSS